MKVLELCCGRWGWSKPFIECGHDVTGIDVNRIMDVPQNARFIQSDIMDWEPDQHYDIVMASPPCTDFSIAKKYAWGTQDERIGLDLVYRVFYLISKIKPKYFLVENVLGLAEFIGKPDQIVRYGRTRNHKHAYLWTNIPSIGMLDNMIEFRSDNFGNSDPRRAEIPRPLSNKVHEILCFTKDRESIL